jgi:hypothetical protein
MYGKSSAKIQGNFLLLKKYSQLFRTIWILKERFVKLAYFRKFHILISLNLLKSLRQKMTWTFIYCLIICKVISIKQLKETI